ncbi:MAG: prephenate dehydratase [Isosphaeraceae bacterium]|nr:prephenate dehydratase [Isosphaeraceae bacterium]
MARKTNSVKPAAASSAPDPAPTRSTEAPEAKKVPALSTLRTEIDRIDKELVALLNRRAEIAVEVGRIKRRQGLDVWSAAREEEVVSRALTSSKGPLPPETLRLIFRELMSGSRALQSMIRVACLGPKFSYSHLASVAKFGEAVEHVPVGSIAAVFEEVNRRHVHFGIVPLENSTDGRIADTLDMFIRTPGLKIRAEVRLRIRHCLLGKCEWGQVRRVYSKAQALSQCRFWLGKNLPHATCHEVVSTAAAAEFAQREPFAAAIASHPAGEAYGLDVLAANIEDQSNNATRFAVIAERAEARTGNDKTTMIIRLSNLSGSLVEAITPFKKNDVNMTWIESFPTAEVPRDRNPTYLFFVDVEGHVDDEPVKTAIDQVRRRVERLEILGSYPRSESVES